MVIHYIILTCRYTNKSELQVNTIKNIDTQHILLYSFIHLRWHILYIEAIQTGGQSIWYFI